MTLLLLIILFIHFLIVDCWKRSSFCRRDVKFYCNCANVGEFRFLPHIVLHASTVAQCIGRNKFRPKEELFREYLFKLGYDEVIDRLMKEGVLNISGKAVLESLPEEVQQLFKVDLEHMQNEKDVKLSIEDIKSSTEDITAQLGLSAEEKKKLDAEIQSQHFTSFGTKQESAILDSIGAIPYRHYVQEELFTLVHEEKKVAVRVILDGVCDGLIQLPGSSELSLHLLEIKQRMHKFLGVREYERVQMLSYLYLHEQSKGVLLESYSGNVRSHIIEFDEQEWKQILEGIKNFALELVDLLESQKA